MNTSKTMRAISQRKVETRPKQSDAGDLCYTLADLNREFPNDDACLEYVKEQRWPNGVTMCDKCNVERKHYRVAGRPAYACDHCWNHIYPLKGTAFAKSTTSLKTWFYVMYLVASSGCRITAKRIQRETGVTYKTAWRTLRQIRLLIVTEQLKPGRPRMEMGSPKVLSIRREQRSEAPPQPKQETAAAGESGPEPYRVESMN